MPQCAGSVTVAPLRSQKDSWKLMTQTTYTTSITTTTVSDTLCTGMVFVVSGALGNVRRFGIAEHFDGSVSRLGFSKFALSFEVFSFLLFHRVCTGN